MSREKCNAIHKSMKAIYEKLDKKVKASTHDKITKNKLEGLRAHAKEMVEDYNVDDAMKFTKQAMENMDAKASKSLLDTINSHRSYTNALRNISGLIDDVTNAQNIKFGVQAFFQQVVWDSRRIIHRLEDGLEKMYKDPTLRNLEGPKVEAVWDLYKNHRSGGRDLLKALETSPDLRLSGDEAQAAILEALSTGFFSKRGKTNGILTVLGGIHKRWDKQMTALIAETNTPFVSRNKYSVPVEENSAILNNMGRVKYNELARKTMNLDFTFRQEKATMTPEKFEKYINDWIEERFTRITEKSLDEVKPKANAKIDGGRAVEFKDFTQEYEYFKAVRSEGSDVLNAAHDHKVNMVRKASLYENFGANPADTLESLIQSVKSKKNVQEAFGVDDVRAIEDHMNNLARQTGVIRTGVSSYDALLTPATDILSRVISAGLVTMSAVRDFFYDRTIHAGLIKSLFVSNQGRWYGPKGAIWESLKSVAGIIRNIGPTKNMKYTKNVFEDVGMSLKVSMVKLINGEEALVDAARHVKTGWTTRGVDTWSKWVSTLSLADNQATASRVFESANSSRLIFRILDGGLEKLGSAEKWFLKRANIDDIDFDDLKKAVRIKFEGTGHHNGSDLLIDVSKLKSSKRGLSNEKEAARELTQKYLNLLEAITSDISVVTSVHGMPWRLEGKQQNIAKLVTKFFAMPLSQYRSLLNNLRAAANLSPSSGWTGDITGPFGLLFSTKGAPLAVKSLLGSVAGGMMIEYMGDFVEGREMQPPDEEFMFKAVTQTGLGGLWTIALSDAYHNDDLVSTPLSAFIGPAKDLAAAPFKEKDKDKKAAAGKAIHRIQKVTPGFNLWYTKALSAWLFDFGLKKEYKSRHKKDKKRGNPYRWR